MQSIIRAIICDAAARSWQKKVRFWRIPKYKKSSWTKLDLFRKLFNPLRGWERTLSHPEFHSGLLLFNPCRGFI